MNDEQADPGRLDYGQLITQPVRLMWQQRFLILFGGAAVLGTLFSGLAGHLLARPWLLGALRETTPTLPGRVEFLVATIIFVLFALLFWLCNVLAEGGLIYAIDCLDDGRPVSGWDALEAAGRFMRPLVVLDTLLFLPLLFVTLLLLFFAVALFVLTIVGINDNFLDVEQGLSLFGGGTVLCVLPLLCASGVVLLLTLLWRTLSFRAAVVDGLGARAALRRSGQLARKHMLSVLLIVGILWVLRNLVNTAGGIFTLPLQWLAAAPLLSALGGEQPAGNASLALIAGLVAALFTFVLAAFLHTYAATLWTVAYRALTGRSSARIGDE